MKESDHFFVWKEQAMKAWTELEQLRICLMMRFCKYSYESYDSIKDKTFIE
jgi:hypothetical protein